MKFIRIFSLLILMMAAYAPSIYADSKKDRNAEGRRHAWNTEMRTVKTDYVTAKLDLTEEQREKFTALYSKMDSEIAAVNRETRAAVDSVRAKGKAATDADYRRASRLAFELKAKEGAIEKSYYAKFQQILTPAQLFSLKDAENQFTRKLMKKHGVSKQSQRKAPAEKKK